MQISNKMVGATLLSVALLFGGGSPLFPTTQLIVEIVGAGALTWYAAHGWRAPVDWWSGAAIALLLLVLALPLVQLVPLPPSIWTSLPGRDDAAEVLRMLGMGQRWMPISLQPDDTRAAAAFLIAPVAMFVATVQAPQRDRVLFGWIVVASALAGALFGLLQAGAGAGIYFYNTAHRGSALGFFANKNHHADLLLIGILLAAALTRTSRQLELKAPRAWAAAAGVVMLALTLPATNSRMGLLLFPAAVIPAALLLLPVEYLRRARVRDAVIALCVLAVVIGIGASSGVVARLLDRFGGDPDPRLKFWPDVLFAIHHYQPVGSGLGSFVKIFQRDESLAALNFTYVNHAHNDFLEIALEAGWTGVALVAAGGMLLLVGAGRVLRPAVWGPLTPMHIACVLGAAILAAHSLVDYPLRTLALSCTFALLAGCLAPAPAPDPPVLPIRRRPRPGEDLAGQSPDLPLMIDR